MKRNFLLTLLLTLLPFVGWAQEEGDVRFVAGNPQEPVTTYLINGEEYPNFAVQYYSGGEWQTVDEPSWEYRENPNDGFQDDPDGPIVSGVASDPGYYKATFEASDEEELVAEIQVIEAQGGNTTPVVVQVRPQSGLTIEYATPVNEIVVLPSYISTNCNAFYSEANKLKIAELLKIKTAEEISKAAAGENPKLEFALIDDENEEGRVIDDLGDGVTYIIEPISPTTIEIVKAQNKLKEGNGLSGFAFDLIQGIPYTGEPQNLVKPVSSTFNFTSYSGNGLGAKEWGKGTAKVVSVDRENDGTIATIEVTKNEPAGTTTADDAARFVGRTFYVYADPTTIPTKRIQLYTYEEEYLPTGIWVSVEAGEESWAKFGEKEGVQFLTISKTKFQELMEEEEDPQEPENYVPAADDANWDTAIPQGTDIDKYYVWARAAAGENWLAGDAEFVEDYAEIVKGIPTFEWTNEIADVYYVNPSGKYGITRGKKNIDFGTVTVTPAAAQSLVKWGYNVADQFDNDGNPTHWTTVQEIVDATEENPGTVFEEGAVYRVFPYVPADDHFDLNALAMKKRKVFTVELPSVTFKTIESQTIAYGTENTIEFNIGNPEWQEYNGNYEPTTGIIDYKWYTDKDCSTEANKDGDRHYPAGETYYVKPVGDDLINIVGNTHVLAAIEPAEVFVSPGEIVCHVEQDVNLVFGQTLPLNLIYEEGAYAPGSKDVEKFQKKTWSGYLKATKIDPKTGEPVADVDPIILNDHEWTTGQGRDKVEHYITTILPVGTWKVGAAEIKGTAADQFIIGSGTWTITPKDIKNEDFTNPAVVGNDVLNHVSKTYTSQEITLDEDDFGDELTYRADGAPRNVALGFVYGNLTLGEDFEITGYTNNINAGTATVSIEGKGNFVGERNLTFTIDKAELKVYPVAEPVQTMAVGETKEFEVDWERLRTDLNTHFRWGKLIDFETETGFKDLTVKRVVGSKVALYPKGLMAYLPEDAEEAVNYEFVPGYAPLNITKGKINLAVKDVRIPYFGEGELTYDDWDLVPTEGTTFLGSKTLEENWKVLVKNLDKVAYEVQTAEKYVVNDEGYTITATAGTGDNALKATDYDVEITDVTGTLFIDPAKLTLKANDRNLNASDFLNKDDQFDEETKAAKINDLKTIDNNSVQTSDLKPGDALTDVVARVNIDETTGVISLTPNANANYVTPTYEAETLIDGKLTINPLDGIVLTSEMAKYEEDDWGDVVGTELIGGDMKTLADKNNLPVASVKLLLKAPKLVNNDGEEVAEYSQWNKNQWHTLVLPFATTPRDISYAFPGDDSYVYVNVADSKNTEIGNVKFKLPDDVNEVIPANTPFCVKTAEAYDYTAEHTVMVGGAENQVEGILLTFNRNIEKYGPYVIVEPTDNIVKDETFENEWGYTFEGTYNQEFVIDNTKSYLRFLGPDNWKFIKSTSTNAKYTLPPYYGYVNLGEDFAGTREVIFTFEEEDGSTTVIKDVDFMNGNKSAEGLYRVDGVKVQGTTTQKGVYIQDGKKFVK